MTGMKEKEKKKEERRVNERGQIRLKIQRKESKNKMN